MRGAAAIGQGNVQAADVALRAIGGAQAPDENFWI